MKRILFSMILSAAAKMVTPEPIFDSNQSEFSNLISNFADTQPRYNESCDSPESGKKCEDGCLDDAKDCEDNCGDESCNAICRRDFFTCIDCKYYKKGKSQTIKKF